MSSNPRVFLIEPSRTDVDLNSTKGFGAVEFVFQPDRKREGAPRHTFRPSMTSVNAYAKCFLEEIESRGYNPATDFFAMTGPLIAVSVSLSALLYRYKKIKVLIFVASMNGYVDKEFSAKDIGLCEVNTLTA